MIVFVRLVLHANKIVAWLAKCRPDISEEYISQTG